MHEGEAGVADDGADFVGPGAVVFDGDMAFEGGCLFEEDAGAAACAPFEDMFGVEGVEDGEELGELDGMHVDGEGFAGCHGGRGRSRERGGAQGECLKRNKKGSGLLASC